MVVLKPVGADDVEYGVSVVKENGSADMDEVVVPVRRSSARLKKLVEQKGKKSLAENDLMKPRNKRVNMKRKCDVGAESSEAKRVEVEVEGEPEGVLNSVPHMRDDDAGDCYNKLKAGTESNENGDEKSDAAVAKDTLRKFNKYYLHYIQEKEKMCRKTDPKTRKYIDSKKEKEKMCGKNNPKTRKYIDSKKAKVAILNESEPEAYRPDLKAITKMKETKSVIFTEKRIGDIPGIQVGYQFFSRAEMVVVGFHSCSMSGIDYMGQSYSKVYENYTLPLAVSIVVSGQYEDDLDNFENIVYTGQGGNDLLGNKRQFKDQDLVRGNLALKNSQEQDLPVRVVRGHKCNNSYVGKVYTYDGLYKVIKYWPEVGLSGFRVYKYSLRRIKGQLPLTTNQVFFTNGGVPKALTDIRGLVCEDISRGEEAIPIPVTNLVDDPPVAPTGFMYHKAMKISKGVKIPLLKTGCGCRGACTDSRMCLCAKRNGSDFPYVLRVNNNRKCYRLIEAKDIVFECGPKCGCGPDCVNRASQRDMGYRLEVFRTPKKGWAVRSWDFIPSGAPVCEYIGVLMKTEEADYDHDNNYIFDIDCLQTIKGLEGREKRYRGVSNIEFEKDDGDVLDIPEYCIDAGSSGNVARFINHSCEPNLFVQCVLSSHHDLSLARIVLFAADNISPLQELTYDYGYTLDKIVGPDGVAKQLHCFCGTAGCKKRLF